MIYNQVMIKIDCLGDMCPLPVMKLGKYKKAIKDGETVLVVCDHSCSTATITDYAKENHFNIEIVEVINGVWEIKIFNTSTK